MANDLITTPWSPPESAAMQKVVKYGGAAAMVGGGTYAFTLFAPTAVTALTLLNQILTNGIYTVGAGVGLIGAAFLARETLSSNGSINRMIRLPYWSLVNGLTRAFIVIDPLSPLTTRIQSVRADKATFEKQFATLDGLIGNLREKARNYREMSNKAQRMGAAAQRTGANAAVQVNTRRYGSYKDAADSYDAMASRLEPMRATFQRIAEAADVTAQKLEIDRDLLRDQWETQKAVHAGVSAASRILGGTSTREWEDAKEAEEIIRTKYGEELGHLEHLKNYAEPFLQSIDVENASYSEDMLAQMQTGGAQLTQSAQARPLPAPSVQGTSNDLLSGLIH